MKKLIIVIFSMLLLFGCSNSHDDSSKDNIKEEIKENFNNIMSDVDPKSSNPYDYTKSKYYDNMVSLGTPAIKVLENMYNDGELTGVNAYLSALLIQDISKCNIYEEYNLDWSTADEFYTLWKDYNCSEK